MTLKDVKIAWSSFISDPWLILKVTRPLHANKIVRNDLGAELPCDRCDVKENGNILTFTASTT